ncbi:hypothetical protein ZIOFF_019347 [Zingiber officinale]|uniref:Uncharacterized protein n=1 Tax=Zingiber officinale TaxID=94328 RepID=A0A8J5LMU9_ZINOF|nr:hypothetical protein ZIOFF_019347 [Zingiber officinale]
MKRRRKEAPFRREMRKRRSGEVAVVVEVIAPAVGGTVNVLKPSSEAKVKLVVVVSSIVAVAVNPTWPHGKIKDESCWSDA